MNCIVNTKSGFTLLEVIVVMLLVGIMTAVAGVGIIHVVEGMIFTKSNSFNIQKGQLAIGRLVKEFTNISKVTFDASQTKSDMISYKTYEGNDEVSRTVTFSGNKIFINKDILMDQVSLFTLNYYDNYDKIQPPDPPSSQWQSSRRIIEITIKPAGTGNIIFQARAKPRNIIYAY